MAKIKKTTKKTTRDGSKVVAALRQVLADSYALMGQTHICHWNVEGPTFFALHTAFENQYTELFTAVDELAERIRALDAYAPGGLANLAKLAAMKEIPEKTSSATMVKHLAGLHAKLIKDAVAARDTAAEANDKETEDMMIARIEVHQKTVWMLKAYLKG
ncbi:DNA starvation/stationary phase protection protein [Puniceicoccales bacterium CK1056]|uniref:DNA starvation/stationary phase protection protein n=1 Tax=Oceanipulchritudo coccoides TaxID=2706888 RepID=A0A6B2LZG3_9BACT|nr:DNA starvation/stationary phase protection protein [Oceanipulchritudo coccoides]NDV61334.1 DNA starvation/stationary phase protection protein [Oceanipulchritudo coccoides]